MSSSSKEIIELTTSSDSDNDDQLECDGQKLQQVLQILPQACPSQVQKLLQQHSSRVEAVIHQLLEEQSTLSYNHEATSLNHRKKRLKTEPLFVTVHEEEHPCTSPVDTFFQASMTMPPPLSEAYQTLIASLPDPSHVFVDPDFPPTGKSLHGRHPTKANESNQVVTCYCQIPATPKQVQADGPNFGKFFLVCGRSNDRTKYQRQPSTKDAMDTVVRPTTCQFFQWDPHGRQGYSAARNLTWHPFGIHNHCILYDPKYGPLPSDVRQGAVGNCWFLSALVVVAEKPWLIRRLLPLEALQCHGIMQVQLCLGGEWTPVIVDCYLPVITKELTAQRMPHAVPLNDSAVCVPAFADCPQRRLWPALVEKAYAKAHGSYQQLSGGFIQEGLRDLTGAPTETIVFHSYLFDADEFWVRLLSFYEAGFCMGVGTSRGGEGLVGGHAYSVLGVYEVRDLSVGHQAKVTDFFAQRRPNEVEIIDGNSTTTEGERETVRLVRIRNPWGKREWKGAWSAASSQWTTALRKHIGNATYARNDGTFFMSYQDMIHRFHHLDVAMTRQGWRHSAKKGAFRMARDPLDTASVCYSIIASERTLSFLSIVQPKKRTQTNSSYYYCDASMVLLSRPRGAYALDNEWKHEASILSGIYQTVDCEVFLDPSNEFMLFVFSCAACQWKQANPYNIVTYSASKIEILEEPVTEDIRISVMTSIQKKLLSNPKKLVYPVAPMALLSCIPERGCIYFLAATGDVTLSLKLYLEIKEGMTLVMGKNDDTHVLPRSSCRVLAVVSRTGKVSASTHLPFRYLASVEPPFDSQRTRQGSYLSGNCDLPLAGDLLVSSMDTSEVKEKGEDKVDIYYWIPQFGSEQ